MHRDALPLKEPTFHRSLDTDVVVIENGSYSMASNEQIYSQDTYAHHPYSYDVNTHHCTVLFMRL